MAQNRYAYQATIEVISGGRDTLSFMACLEKNKQAYFDASTALVDCLQALRRDQSMTISTGDPEADDFLAAGRAEALCRLSELLNADDTEAASWRVTALARTIDQLRNGRVFSLAEPEQPAQPEPMNVRIVQMPDRETSTAVTYDAAGNIKRTSQTERDTA